VAPDSASDGTGLSMLVFESEPRRNPNNGRANIEIREVVANA
jgi:hypothetical protein